MEAKKLDNLSVAEYIAVERTTQTRHEYHDGRIFAMSGGTLEHGLISGNTFGELKFGLRKKNSDCTAINSDVKVYVKSLNKYVYPDVMVVCGEIEKSADEAGAVMNPTVIVEVLSQSTESYDRGDKFYIYRQIETLKEYILIDQYQPQVEVFRREADLWNIQRISGIEQDLEIKSLGLTIALGGIYEGVDFLDGA